MRVRFFTREGRTLATGNLAGDTQLVDIFRAMNRGELCVDAVQMVDAPAEPPHGGAGMEPATTAGTADTKLHNNKSKPK